MMSENITLELSVPTRMSDIKLEQYQKYLKVVDGVEQESEESVNFVNLKALEIFCGLQLKESYKLPLSEFGGIIEDLSSALAEKTPLVKRFWFRGDNGNEVEFGMIPDLNNMSFGEYVDLDTYLADWELMNKAIGVLYRPLTYKKKHQYLIEDYESADKYDMTEVTLDVVFGAIVFFYSLKNELQKTILNYLATQKEVELPQHLRDSLQNGAGINLSTDLLMETFSNTIKLQNQNYTPV